MLGLGWWTHHPFGIVGAGISSLLSETIAACYAIAYTARRPAYRIFDEVSLSWPLALPMCRSGPARSGLSPRRDSCPTSSIVAMLAPLGATAVAAFRALNVVSDLTFVVPSPLQSAAQVVIGQRLGARDPAGARWFFERARRVSLMVTTIAGASSRPWPGRSHIFSRSTPDRVDRGAAARAAHVTLPLKGWAMVSLAPIRASGDTRFSMTVGIFCSALVIPLAWIGIERLHLGSIAWAWVGLRRGSARVAHAVEAA